jgi:hypothetical protein
MLKSGLPEFASVSESNPEEPIVYRG